MKYDCDIIRDLMPLCMENMASENSQTIVQEHLAECKSCAAEWEDIRSGSLPETEVSEETRQFAKAATRVKKKHIRVLCSTVLATVLVIAGAAAVNVFGICGGRFQPESAVVIGLQRNHIADSFETVWTDFPAYEREAISFLRYTEPQSNTSKLMAAYTFGAGPCWFFGGALGKIDMPSEPGVYAVTDPLGFRYYNGYYYYVNDPAVKTLTITCGEQIYSVQIEDYPNGICPFHLEHRYRQAVDTISGTACDADGQVLYTLQGNIWVPA